MSLASARPPTARLVACLCTSLWLALGCQTAQEKRTETVYGPTESLLEVVAVLRRHVNDDTYRFLPATDFTGRNVYRSTLLRLENLERVHADALRLGHMDAVIQFAKARSLERLRAFDLAVEHYRSAAEQGGALRSEALRSADVCEQIQAARKLGFELRDPLASSSTDSNEWNELNGSATRRDLLPRDPDVAIASLDERVARLSALYEQEAERHYAFIIREELEHSDSVRSQYFVAMRHSLPDGQIRAVGELQRLVVRHAVPIGRATPASFRPIATRSRWRC